LAAVDNALHYLSKRLELIDYPHFQAQGFPIGSGSVESSHKVVVQSRMTRGGMRWAVGGPQIVTFHWQQKRQEMIELARRQHPSGPPITFASVEVAPSPSVEERLPAPKPKKSKQPYRPAPDHPWRRGIWPSKESTFFDN
jgi:hypothetical protein